MVISGSSALMTAGIALGGTIFGALTVAITQVITARANRRSQQEAANLQYESQQRAANLQYKSQQEAVSLQYANDYEKLLRAERIKIYVDFLAAVDNLDNLREAYMRYHAEAPAEKQARPSPSDDDFDEVSNRVWRGYRAISLLSGKDVESLALRYAAHHSDRAEAARDNTEQPAREEGVTAGALSEIMRQEIGVLDGRKVNLGTGLYEDKMVPNRKPPSKVAGAEKS
jgi:hypothetical protein